MTGGDLLKAVLTKPGPQKQVGADPDSQSPLEIGQNWIDARKKMQDGWPSPIRKFYVVIAAGTVVDTAQKLKDIAEMCSDPVTFDTVYKDLCTMDPEPGQMGKDGKPIPVRVGIVEWEELKRIKSKADCVVNLCILVDGKTKGVTKVINYKKPATTSESTETFPLSSSEQCDEPCL